ncbi:MAG TPA: hypothetical protein DGG94_22660 [Micromonosporaceae bacterium]|nr:hypothetical protein [Micromonosporaceae bacterium]HCU52560.1 hypothetical protein [Micromonosporaceae bacterium]
MKRTDAEEFTSYVEAWMDRWRRTAYLLSRDWHTADDLVSIMVSKVFRSGHSLHGSPFYRMIDCRRR